MERAVILLWDTYLGFLDDDGWAIASHVALSALMSLFPFLIVVTSLAGFFGSKELADEVIRILFETWPPQASAPISAEIRAVLTTSRGDLLTIGVLLSLYFSSNGIEAMRIALNRAYNFKELRPWWLLRLESIAYIVLGAIALLALAFLVVLGPLLWHAILNYVPDLAPFSGLATGIRIGVTGLVIIVALIVAHRILPNGTQAMWKLWPGILLTLVAMLGGGYVFSGYLAEFSSNYINTYAGLASVMTAIVFLYSTAAMFILGGEFNAALLRHTTTLRDMTTFRDMK